jgi:hypothetical protein
MKQFFEKIKFKLFSVGAVAIIAWFGSLLARLPNTFERIQYLVGWEAVGIFSIAILTGLVLLAVLVFFALFVSVLLEELLDKEN